MDMVVYLTLVFILLIAIAQWQNHRRVSTLTSFFTRHKLNSVLVCNDPATAKFWFENIDREKYGVVRVINCKDPETYDDSIDTRLWEWTVRRAGVMRYPCLLTLEANGLKGKFFEETIIK